VSGVGGDDLIVAIDQDRGLVYRIDNGFELVLVHVDVL
jgi:hypothetical protein